MARAKKIAAVDEATVTEETVLTEAVELPPAQDNGAEITRLFAEIEYELAKLGHIGHLYYAKKVGEKLSKLTAALKSLL